MANLDVGAELGRALSDAAREMGRDLTAGLAEVQEYAAQRTLYLSTIVGEPGYELALRAERDAVALRAGIVSVTYADAADQRMIGVIGGALAIGARALAVLA